MSLLLVRHGQASAGSDNYDRLSERGWQQSRRLGAWLASTGHDFDAVVLGGMRRHQETFDAIAVCADSLVAIVVSPTPESIAALPAKTAAPVYSFDPTIKSACPRLFL